MKTTNRTNAAAIIKEEIAAMIDPLAEPVGSSAMNDFDSTRWRVVRPVMDKERCTECGVCRFHCPMGIVYADGKTIRINYDKCIGCGICAVNCPIHAITMKPKPGALS